MGSAGPFAAETLDYWSQAIALNPDLPVRFEIELWFYENPVRRAQAYTRIEQEIQGLNGTVIHHAVIPEIRYDAVLRDLSARADPSDAC